MPLACHQGTGVCTPGEPGFIVLDARLQALEAVLGGIIEECTGAASALSHAFIGKTMMTVQEVRTVKGSLGGMDFIDVP